MMKVLVAEDDPNILAGVIEVLEDEGYEPIASRDGAEALLRYHTHQPDFVILDIMMPEMNGYDVCREIRKLDATLPIVFLSAKSEEIDKVIGLELGADDYISKPFGIKEFIARIRAVARRAQRSTPAPPTQPEVTATPDDDASFVMGTLEIFPSELRARRDEQVMDLSLRDIKILQVLFANEGKVMDRNTLFNECWGMDYFPNSRTLDQHISQLRKKIEVDPKQPTIIRTVHGVGYRFEQE